MSEAKEDDEDEEEKPSWIVKYSNVGHDNDGDKEDGPTLPSQKGIGDVASI